MSHTTDDKPAGLPRREFLHTGARTLLFGGLLGYFAQQHVKAARLVNDPSCIKLNTCSDCIEFNGCKLPKSAEFREAKLSQEAGRPRPSDPPTRPA